MRASVAKQTAHWFAMLEIPDSILGGIKKKIFSLYARILSGGNGKPLRIFAKRTSLTNVSESLNYRSHMNLCTISVRTIGI